MNDTQSFWKPEYPDISSAVTLHLCEGYSWEELNICWNTSIVLFAFIYALVKYLKSVLQIQNISFKECLQRPETKIPQNLNASLCLDVE